MPDEPSRWWDRRRLGLVAAVVLSAATVLTAWSAFESAKWSGQQAAAFNRASAARTESLRLSGQAEEQEIVDSGAFSAWLEADLSGQAALAARLADHFSPALRVAFDDWGRQGHPPASPLELPSYRLGPADQAAVLTRQAEVQFDRALTYNQRADDYVLMTVLFSGALFLGGLAGRLERRSGAEAMVAALAVVVLFVAVGVTFSLPVRL
jgi:hypothetical protein